MSDKLPVINVDDTDENSDWLRIISKRDKTEQWEEKSTEEIKSE